MFSHFLFKDRHAFMFSFCSANLDETSSFDFVLLLFLTLNLREILHLFKKQNTQQEIRKCCLSKHISQIDPTYPSLSFLSSPLSIYILVLKGLKFLTVYEKLSKESKRSDKRTFLEEALRKHTTNFKYHFYHMKLP